MNKALLTIERIGNKIPNPSLMFFTLAMAMIAISAVCALFSLDAVNPITDKTIVAKSLLSDEGIRYMLQNMVSNFMNFAPLGIVLVAMLGIGIAEQSKLLEHLISSIVKISKNHGLTFFVAFVGILSSIGADSGYVVLIPLSALLFKSAGRSPIAGIATAFAGVSGGYSANLLVGPIDAVLAGLSTEAIQIVDPNQSVAVTDNWLFMIFSTIFIALIITAVTHWTEPSTDSNQKNIDIASKSASFKSSIIFSIFFVCILSFATIPESAILRDPVNQSLTPFVKSLVILIAIYFAGCGLCFGFSNGIFRSGQDVIDGLETTMKTLASYLVMMFFAAQFIAYFNWSNLGMIIAVNGANFLAALELNSYVLLILFIFISASINLFIGSASAKWALMAPIFIPMLALLGISPEYVQVAYRIGDSSTNIITPMMPYFALVLAFAQQHDKKAGLGTLIATMLPYSIALLITWPALLFIWMILGLPIGL